CSNGAGGIVLEKRSVRLKAFQRKAGIGSIGSSGFQRYIHDSTGIRGQQRSEEKSACGVMQHLSEFVSICE
ncbi:hypothetical protein ACQKI4_15070, partial [Paenibacillus glucanolyticus]|uniref:hypothetical protein n=1 Tax=Paenibacillus glucanolyticus TaxID=59843 RepID=UPI003D007E26